MAEPVRTAADLIAALGRDIAGLERELSEIELLATQARSESGRHEQKRAHLAERLATIQVAPTPEIADQNAQLITLTKRAALMDAQIDVLLGKQKVLARYRDALVTLREDVARFAGSGVRPATPGPAAAGQAGSTAAGAGSAVVHRLLQSAQEDLRRDIARAMHDGPAQSLTNIVLQTQIVERLIDRDPAAARAEVRELVSMVQRTLEATKTFIFDVRPMVLDDLGLVPTLRRVARDRSRRAQVPIEFGSMGSDRRLPVELESAVFRIVDDSVAALTPAHPERVTVTLEWGATELTTTVRAHRVRRDEEPAPEPIAADVPAALAVMIESRRADRAAEIAAGGIPADVRREIADRAASLGGGATVDSDGQGVEVVIPAPSSSDEASRTEPG